MKSGLRQMKVTEDKKVKKHVKAFYSIIGEIDKISKQLDPTIKYTEENINEYVNPILGRDLDNMEQFLLLGKLNVVNNETKDNN
jgi:hypothetical protein